MEKTIKMTVPEVKSKGTKWISFCTSCDWISEPVNFPPPMNCPVCGGLVIMVPGDIILHP